MLTLPSKQFKDILPQSYRKRNVFVSVFPECGLNINSYWDGGSKDYYHLVELDTKKKIDLPSSTHPYFDVAGRGLANQSNPAIEISDRGNITLKFIPENVVLVNTGIFCGKVATVHLYIHPNNMPKFLGE